MAILTGGRGWRPLLKVGPFTYTARNTELISGNMVAGAGTVYAPANPEPGDYFAVSITANGNSITVDGNGKLLEEEHPHGTFSATVVMTGVGSKVRYIYDGAQWLDFH